MNFEEFIYSANVWGNIDNAYDDPNIKHIRIEVTNYDDDDNEIKIGEVDCRLYNTEGEDARILLDCDSSDAITTAMAIADEFNLDLIYESMVAYIESICLEPKWQNQGIETYILEHFAKIINTLMWHIPTLVIMCATPKEFEWMPGDVKYVENDRVKFCCLYSHELDWQG